MVMGLQLSDLPGTIPYLSPERARLAKWRKRLAKLPRPLVALVWAGRPSHHNDANRSMSLADLAPLALPGITYLAIQKGPKAEEAKAPPPGMSVVSLSDEIADFEDTAAILSIADLLISVDSSPVHLAGALGRPAWVMLPFVPDWRWLTDRADTPWYPSLRLIRQQKRGDWAPVLHEMAKSLAALEPAEVSLDPAEVPLPAAAAVAAPVPDSPVVLKECRHGKMLFLWRDIYVGRSLDLYGEFSHLETTLFSQFAQPGMVVIEVGANVGAHTVSLARMVGPQGMVVALEPQRVIFQLLCANVALNGLFNVRTHQAAAGRKAGTLMVPPLDYAAENNFGGISLSSEAGGESVPVITLDSLALPVVHIVKIDVEGMEADVLAGARQLIARHRPVLYLENDRREKSAALIRQLDKLGYECWWHTPPMFNPDNAAGRQENVFPGILSLNLVCLPKERPMVMDGFRKVAGPDDWPLS